MVISRSCSATARRAASLVHTPHIPPREHARHRRILGFAPHSFADGGFARKISIRLADLAQIFAASRSHVRSALTSPHFRFSDTFLFHWRSDFFLFFFLWSLVRYDAMILTVHKSPLLLSQIAAGSLTGVLYKRRVILGRICFLFLTYIRLRTQESKLDEIWIGPYLPSECIKLSRTKLLYGIILYLIIYNINQTTVHILKYDFLFIYIYIYMFNWISYMYMLLLQILPECIEVKIYQFCKLMHANNTNRIWTD